MSELTERDVQIYLWSKQVDLDPEEVFEEQQEEGEDGPGIPVNLPSDVSPEDVEAVPLELRLTGKLRRKNGRIILSYEESELTGMKDATTSISFAERMPGLVSMLRYGAVSTALVFEEEVRHICTYDTHIIPLEICVHAHRVHNTLTMEGGVLELDYRVEIHGVQQEHILLKLEVRPTGEAVAKEGDSL